MTNGLKTMLGIFTEMSDKIYWELADSRMITGNLHRNKLGPLSVGDVCVVWEVCGTTGSRISIFFPSALAGFMEPILYEELPCSA